MKRPKPSFMRSDTVRHLRLGKKRQGLRKWRKSRGRHNKIRRKHVGYPVSPSIGYGQPKVIEGLVKGKRPVVIVTAKELMRVNKQSEVVVLARRLGARKRLELIKQAQAAGLSIHNLKGAGA